MAVSRETTALSLPLSAPQRSRLSALADWVATRACPLGLTTYSHPDQAFREAVAPALALPAMLGYLPVGPWADFGAGSGALGLALASLCPAAHFDLIDRRQRVTAFLDLSIRRLSIPNAYPLLLNITADTYNQQWAGVCLRAFATPAEALLLAAHHARHWICAWHAPHIVQYRTPQPAFRLVCQTPTSSPNLVASLYERVRESEEPCG